jgi:hypothetical protein
MIKYILVKFLNFFLASALSSASKYQTVIAYLWKKEKQIEKTSMKIIQLTMNLTLKSFVKPPNESFTYYLI